MPKTCKAPECSYYVWGKGYCKIHQHLRVDKKTKQKKKNYIKPISDKRAQELAIYRQERDKYMKEHPKCECGCGGDSQDLHHKGGRTGKKVYYKPWFMAVTRKCHERIHLNPVWAREKGYLI